MHWIFGGVMFIVWVYQLVTWRRSWKINEYEECFKLAANSRVFPFWFDEDLHANESGRITFYDSSVPSDWNCYKTREAALEAINKFSEWEVEEDRKFKEGLRKQELKKTYKVIEDEN